MDFGMSSGWAAFLVAEFCGVPDFPTAERWMPHMMRRAATRKRLILVSGIQKRIREPRREVERYARCGVSGRVVRKGRILIPFYAAFRPLFRRFGCTAGESAIQTMVAEPEISSYELGHEAWDSGAPSAIFPDGDSIGPRWDRL